MREKIRDEERLQHILEAISNIFEFIEGVTLEDYSNNKMLRYAVVKNLEIIGEAAYLLSKDLKDHYPEIEWNDIVSMRHLLVHGYYHIKDSRVWYTIVNELTPLQEKIKQIQI
jgi:uncharacterized protein with HEPN domain